MTEHERGEAAHDRVAGLSWIGKIERSAGVAPTLRHRLSSIDDEGRNPIVDIITYVVNGCVASVRAIHQVRIEVEPECVTPITLIGIGRRGPVIHIVAHIILNESLVPTSIPEIESPPVPLGRGMFVEDSQRVSRLGSDSISSANALLIKQGCNAPLLHKLSKRVKANRLSRPVSDHRYSKFFL